MGESATRVEEAMAAMRAGLETLQSQMGSLDSRMELMDNAYQ